MHDGSFNLQGVPKKMLLLSGFEFLTMGGVFLGVKNDFKNFENQQAQETFKMQLTLVASILGKTKKKMTK